MKKKILVVEDEEDVLGLLEGYLTQEGFDVTTATNGIEGLEKYGSDFDGLVITDLDMPKMGGIEFLKNLKIKDPDCIGIILTGQGSMETCVLSLRDGLAYDYLMKPLENIDLLLTACQRAWEKRDLELQNRSLMDSLKRSNTELLETLERLEKAQNELVESKRIMALAEMAGAVAHEINNPLCAINTNVHMLLQKKEKDHPDYKILSSLKELVDRVSGVTQNIMNVRSYKTKPYVGEKRIIDLERAAEEP